MSKSLFLGRPAFDPQPYSRVDPIAIARAGAWRTRGDWSSALPPEGRAFARQLPGFTARSLVAFGIEPNTKAENGKDQFSVVNPEHVYEVLDYRNSDAEVARRQLVEIGQPRLLPGSESVVAALRGGLCVKVKMSRHPTTDFLVADFAGLEHLPLHGFDERLFEGDQVEGRWITVPGLSFGAVMGAVNWCRDADFLEAALKRVRKAGAQASAGGPTRQQLDQLLTQLGRADLLPSDGTDLAAMRDRLRTFEPSLIQNVAILDEIVVTLSALTPIRNRLIADFSEEKAAIEREIRQALEDKLFREIEASFAEVSRDRELHEARQDKLMGELDASYSELAQERDGLAAEVAGLESSLDGKRVELDQVRQSLDTARAALAADLSQLLGELGGVPLPSDADVAQLGARVAAKLGEPGAAFEVAVQTGPPWTTPRQIVGQPKSWEEFDQELATAARQWGFSVDDLRMADVVVRGGGLVILPEKGASRFVGCYSSVVAGGEFGRHVLDPSVISLDDLWRLPGSGRQVVGQFESRGLKS